MTNTLNIFEVLTKKYEWDHMAVEEFTAFMRQLLYFNPS
jgi:hypothetical protein